MPLVWFTQPPPLGNLDVGRLRMSTPVTAENDGPGTMLLPTQNLQKMPFRELPRRPKMVAPAWLPAQEDTRNEIKRVSGRANGIPRTFIQEVRGEAISDILSCGSFDVQSYASTCRETRCGHPRMCVPSSASNPNPYFRHIRDMLCCHNRVRPGFLYDTTHAFVADVSALEK